MRCSFIWFLEFFLEFIYDYRDQPIWLLGNWIQEYSRELHQFLPFPNLTPLGTPIISLDIDDSITVDSNPLLAQPFSPQHHVGHLPSRM
jgi:hypothetical protein